MRKAPRAGFTLMELIMALVITGVILVTIMYLSTNAVRYQTESVIRDSNTSAALYSLARMRRELEDATFIQKTPGGCNSFSGSGCDQVGGCTNWNNVAGAYTSAPTTSFYYCMSGTQVYRYEQNGCNTTFSAGCGSGGYTDVVVPDPPGVYHTGSGDAMFVKSGDSSVDLHYVVGYPGQKANLPVPVDYLFNIRVNVNKAYSDTND